MKQLLVGTTIGRFGARARGILELATAPAREIDTIANDQIATALVAKLCRADGVFVDVGSHIGFFVAEVLHFRPRAQVIAFEPVPAKARFLKKKFPKADVRWNAVGEKTCETTFFVNVKRSGYSSLLKLSEDTDAIKVPMIRLDDACLPATIDVIKIDVEGAELGVLRGGLDTVRRDRPLIMFESGPETGFGYTRDAIFDWMVEARYELYVPNRVGSSGNPLSREAFLDGHEYPRRTTNYYAIPVERRDEIWKRLRL